MVKRVKIVTDLIVGGSSVERPPTRFENSRAERGRITGFPRVASRSGRGYRRIRHLVAVDVARESYNAHKNEADGGISPSKIIARSFLTVMCNLKRLGPAH